MQIASPPAWRSGWRTGRARQSRLSIAAAVGMEQFQSSVPQVIREALARRDGVRAGKDSVVSRQRGSPGRKCGPSSITGYRK